MIEIIVGMLFYIICDKLESYFNKNGAEDPYFKETEEFIMFNDVNHFNK